MLQGQFITCISVYMDTCISVYNIQSSEGLSDLLEPHFCCDRLRSTGEPREVSDEFKVQL
jgi:hypothetical protein